MKDSVISSRSISTGDQIVQRVVCRSSVSWDSLMPNLGENLLHSSRFAFSPPLALFST
jgi:hypothetical protein